MTKPRQSSWAVAIALCSSVSICFTPSSAAADQLGDFQTAVSKIGQKGEGCKTIPYDDLQRNCIEQQQSVHTWCDGDKGPVTCQANVSSALTQSLVAEYKREDTLKRKQIELEDAIRSATNDVDKAKLQQDLEQTKLDIYNSNKAINDIKTALDQREDLVDGAIYNIGKCMDYRRAVMNVFASAIDRVRSETQPEIQPLARTLLGSYQDSKDGHQTAIVEKENALATCKKEEL